MTDKEKMKKLVAYLEHRMYAHNQMADIGSTGEIFDEKIENAKYEECRDILNFIDSISEESISIWHDTSEEPNINSMIIYKLNGCVPDVGRFLGSAGVEGHFSWEIFKYPRSIIINNIEKWAHIDDILKL